MENKMRKSLFGLILVILVLAQAIGAASPAKAKNPAQGAVLPEGCQCSNFTVPNTVCKMTGNLTANGTCFGAWASNVTIDCNGFSITGNNGHSSYGVYATADHVTVKNCVISGFEQGVSFVNGAHTSNGFVENVNVTCGTYAASSAIRLEGDGSHTVTRLSATCDHYPALMVYQGTNDTIANSTFSSFAGIYLGGSNSTIYSNVFLGNIGIYISSGSAGNRIYWNNFTAGLKYYITKENNGGPNYFNTTINGRGEGNIYANVLNGSVNVTGAFNSSGFPGLRIGSGGTGYPYNRTTSGGMVEKDVVDYAPLTQYASINGSVPRAECLCGNLTTQNYVCNVTRDLVSNGTCFDVQATNVTINCNGHTITGSNATGSYGIYSNQNFTEIYGCTINGFENGVYFSNANNGNLNNVTVSSTLPILLAYSNNNTLRGVYATSTGGKGIWLVGSTDNSLSVFVTAGMIVLQAGANRNVVSDFNSTSNGIGIWLLGSSSNTIAGFSAATNSSPAISLTSGTGNVIANGTLTTAHGTVANIATQSNAIYNNTFISGDAQSGHVTLQTNASSNLFYWNSFTATNGTYVNDLNGSNYYNTTMDGRGEGNLWADVLDGSVNIGGENLSEYGQGYYAGAFGTEYPYNNDTSQGKLVGNAVDFAPLTLIRMATANFIVDGSAGGTTNGTAYDIVVPLTMPMSAIADAGHTFSSWSSVGDCTVNNPASASATAYDFGAVCNVTATFASSAGSEGSGNGGGNSGSNTAGSGGSLTSTGATETIQIEVCKNVTCNIRVTRSMASTNTSSVMTTIIENAGGSACALEDFTYSDALPGNFASVDELSFYPSYSMREGQTVGFVFLAFAPGESRTLTYAAQRWVLPSGISLFGTPALSTKKCIVTPPVVPPVVNQTVNVTAPPITPVQPPPLKLEIQIPFAPLVNDLAIAASLFGIDLAAFYNHYWWAICLVATLADLMLFALVLRKKCNNKKCEATNWLWVSKCHKCGHIYSSQKN